MNGPVQAPVPLVSFAIATRDRRAELLETLAAIRAQDHPRIEVHVVDDGSTDGTFDAVRAHFPEVKVTRNESPLGSVPSRNLILGRARGEFLFGLDDDSRLIAPDAVRRVLVRFAAEPDLGLVEFQEQGPQFPATLAPGGLADGEWHIASFSANRYALRTAVLPRTGPFAALFGHAGEEPDLALRIWDAGYRCLRWNTIVVWHAYSPLNRDDARVRRLQTRNALLGLVLRAPFPYALALGPWRALSQLGYGIGQGTARAALAGMADALRSLPRALAERRPVRARTLRQCLVLGRRRVADPGTARELAGRGLVRGLLSP